MNTSILLVLTAFLLTFTQSTFLVEAKSVSPTSKITVMGIVYCDICSSNSFSKHSYFLQGADVHIDCKIEMSLPATTEQVTFSVNRTTDKFGVYKLDIPSVDGVKCAEGRAIESLCRASLIGSSASSCNVPGVKMTTDKITIKSKQTNQCIYCFNALSYRPAQKNVNLCENGGGGTPSSSLIP